MKCKCGKELKEVECPDCQWDDQSNRATCKIPGYPKTPCPTLPCDCEKGWAVRQWKGYKPGWFVANAVPGVEGTAFVCRNGEIRVFGDTRNLAKYPDQAAAQEALDKFLRKPKVFKVAQRTGNIIWKRYGKEPDMKQEVPYKDLVVGERYEIERLGKAGDEDIDSGIYTVEDKHQSWFGVPENENIQPCEEYKFYKLTGPASTAEPQIKENSMNRKVPYAELKVGEKYRIERKKGMPDYECGYSERVVTITAFKKISGGPGFQCDHPECSSGNVLKDYNFYTVGSQEPETETDMQERMITTAIAITETVKDKDGDEVVRITGVDETTRETKKGGNISDAIHAREKTLKANSKDIVLGSGADWRDYKG